jgi:hypothetical protein
VIVKIFKMNGLSGGTAQMHVNRRGRVSRQRYVKGGT